MAPAPLTWPLRRLKAGLMQTQLAARMKITQSVGARLESGRVHPSYKILEKIARVTGTRLSIRFETTWDAT